MTTIRTLRKLTKLAAELEQLAKSAQTLAPELAAAAEAGAQFYRPGFPRQSQQTVKGRIERA